MKSIDTVVRAKLAAHVGQQDATALWEKLWTAFEGGGVEGAESFIEELLESPEPGGVAGDEVDDQ
jgi:hypothetical protein